MQHVAEVMETDYLELGDIHAIRWVASKVRAMLALKADWSALVTYLESVAVQGRSSDEKAVS